MKTKSFFQVALGGILGGLIFLLIASFRPQDDSPRYVTLNTYEFNSAFRSKIVIIFENAEVEEIALEKPDKEKNIHSNAMKLHETINMLTHRGYKLLSATKDMNYGHYLFEKH